MKKIIKIKNRKGYSKGILFLFLVAVLEKEKHSLHTLGK